MSVTLFEQILNFLKKKTRRGSLFAISRTDSRIRGIVRRTDISSSIKNG